MTLSPSIALLRDGGRISERLPDYEARPQQLAMAFGIEQAFAKAEHLIVEAGTGTGKSFSYLIPAIFEATSGRKGSKPVVISTSTIALQEQLEGKDVPFLRSILGGREFSVVLAKGRSNYISKRRLELAMQNAKNELFEGSGRQHLESIYEWSATTRDGSRADLDFEPHSSVWEQIVSDSNNCRGRQCPYVESCFFQKARRRIFNANILIVNHSLFFSDLALKRAGVSFLPNYEYAILDEAHDIERVASDALGLRLSEGMVNHLLNRVSPFGDSKARSRRGLAQKYEYLQELVDMPYRGAKQAAGNFFRSVERLFGDRRDNQLRLRQAPDLSDQVARALGELGNRLDEGARMARDEDAESDISSAAKRAHGLAEGLTTWVTQGDTGQVYWLERYGAGQRIEMRSAPVHVGKLLEETLFSKTRSVILTSATLATGGSKRDKGAFAFLRERLGLPAFHQRDALSAEIPDEVFAASLEVPEQEFTNAKESEIDPFEASKRSNPAKKSSDREEMTVRELLLGSPFDYPRQAQLVLPDLPEPNGPNYDNAIAEAAKNACLESPGGVFLLFTSYYQLRRVYDAIQPELSFNGFVLLRQGDDLPRTKMLEVFRQQKRAVLFGTESFWQGVDVPGDALTTVVIAKLPFPVPSDPLIEARSEQIQALGGNAFYDYSVPQAIIKLKQGFGRLIRRATDTGKVVILDSRLRNKAYGRRFIESLPPAEVVIE